jgi:predicted ATPase
MRLLLWDARAESDGKRAGRCEHHPSLRRASSSPSVRLRVVRLNRVDIQAYRSVYGVSIAPGPFTVLVGPNNAGKTNLVDALQFLAEVARSGLEVAVGREGGFENLAFRRQRRTRRRVQFGFQLSLPASEIGRPMMVDISALKAATLGVEYSFSLRASSGSRDTDYSVAHETLSLTAPGAGVFHMNRANEEVSASWEGELNATNPENDPLLQPLFDDFLIRYLENSPDPGGLTLTKLAINPIVQGVLDSLGSTRLFQLTPVECRKPGASTPNPDLDRHGSNLPAVVRHIKQRQPAEWRKTLAAMRNIIPDLTDIETAYTSDRRLTLSFVEDDGQRSWSADEVSDGTVQSLAMFSSLYDARTPLILVEEPENSVHPWIVKRFVDGCREARDKQIIVTTHSPALISYLMPSELTVVWRSNEGHTELSPITSLDPQAESLWASGSINLYDIIDGGWIRQSTPLGLQ